MSAEEPCDVSEEWKAMLPTLTNVQPARDGTAPRKAFTLLNGLPGVPTAELVNLFAITILDLVPFDKWFLHFSPHTGHVKNISKVDGWYMATNVGWCERADYWHAVGEDTQVNEIDLNEVESRMLTHGH